MANVTELTCNKRYRTIIGFLITTILCVIVAAVGQTVRVDGKLSKMQDNIGRMQEQIGNLRVTVGELKTEIKYLRHQGAGLSLKGTNDEDTNDSLDLGTRTAFVVWRRLHGDTGGVGEGP